jgi:3-oxoacid CoA-transferase subunit A
MTIMAGALASAAENLIAAFRRAGVKNLSVISNNCGIDDFGLGVLLAGGQIRKKVSSHVGENKPFERMYSKACRSSGSTCKVARRADSHRRRGRTCAFFTKTGVSTLVAQGKEVREFDGELYVMERSLTADLINAGKQTITELTSTSYFSWADSDAMIHG